jgi:hypothetical protein
MLRECGRMLRTGARLLLVEWRAPRGAFGPPSQAIVKEEAMRAGLERTGFAVVDRFDPSPIHYAVVAVKMERSDAARVAKNR